MSWIRHGIVVAAAALGMALALLLPELLASVGRHEAVLYGLVLFLAGALLRQALEFDEVRQRLERRLRDGRRRIDALEATLAALQQRLDSAPEGVGGAVGAVLSEARVLQTLAHQLPPQPRPATPAVPPAAPPPVPQPAPPAAPAAASTVPEVPAALPAAAMLERIRTALRTDQVDILLQPVVSLPQRKHRYYEVFSRIRGEDGSHFLPEQYLGVAAEAGLIAAIDNMLLFRCVQLIRETEKRHQNVGFFCNISAATLNDAGFMREFVQFMGQHPNLVTKLVFELAQADLMDGGVFATGFLDGLRRLGFRFSMDQVDSLDVDWDELARHEIRYVKLDAARLLDPEGRFARPEKVRELKRLLDRNAIDLIAEKIETEKQLLELLDLYIDFGQGYLFGEPRLARKREEPEPV